MIGRPAREGNDTRVVRSGTIVPPHGRRRVYDSAERASAMKGAG